jgi:hypothetical protein
MTRLQGRRHHGYSALLLISIVGCSSEVDTQMRTLPSGRQIEVFRIFPQKGPNGTMLNYAYFTVHFGDQAAFEQERTDVLEDAQREADQQKADTLVLGAMQKDRGLFTLLTGRGIRSWLYRRDGQEWRKMRED